MNIMNAHSRTSIPTQPKPMAKLPATTSNLVSMAKAKHNTVEIIAPISGIRASGAGTGPTHLNCWKTAEGMEQVIWVEGGLEAFAFETAFGRVLFEQGHGDATDQA